MKDFDYNSLKAKVLFAIIALLMIFCFARLIKPIVYDEAEVTHVYNVNGKNFVIHGYRSQSTEEWEKNIKAHNKSNIDEIESSITDDEESKSQ